MVRDAAWGCDWVGTPAPIQRCLVFIIATANKEFTMTAGEFVPVCNTTMMNARVGIEERYKERLNEQVSTCLDERKLVRMKQSQRHLQTSLVEHDTCMQYTCDVDGGSSCQYFTV